MTIYELILIVLLVAIGLIVALILISRIAFERPPSELEKPQAFDTTTQKIETIYVKAWPYQSEDEMRDIRDKSYEEMRDYGERERDRLRDKRDRLRDKQDKEREAETIPMPDLSAEYFDDDTSHVETAHQLWMQAAQKKQDSWIASANNRLSWLEALDNPIETNE